MSRRELDSTSVETLRDWDRSHLWHPFANQAEWDRDDPVVIDRGDGVYLYDRLGNRYLDGVSSLWCNVHGHRRSELDRAIVEQLGSIAHSTLLGITHPTAIALAKRLVELAPEGLTRVFFSDDGATAVEVALKMAFQYWRQLESPEPKRTKFLALSNAYHGDTLGAVGVGGVERFHATFGPLLFPTLRAPAPFCYRCPLSLEHPKCAIACLNEVERSLSEHDGEVAAVVVEPLVQGAAGMIVHPPGYLGGIASLCKKYNVLLIADEVAVGFGRTGTLFACEAEGVSPDFLCLAKGLTGGYLPLAATLTTERVRGAFVGDEINPKTFYHGHTYSGNPLAAAVALANLDLFGSDETLDKLPAKIDRLGAGLEGLARLDHVGDVRRRGLIAGIELVLDKETKTPFSASDRIGARVCLVARRLGVLLRPLGDVIVIMPPLSIDLEQIDELVAVVSDSIIEITRPLL